MAFNPVSPGVYSSEVNVSTSVPIIGTSTGAIAGVFNWGPLFQPTLVTSQQQLQTFFGVPTNNNAETWFSAYNFLNYSTSLFVVRTSLSNLIANSTVNTMPNAAITAVANDGGITVNNVLMVTNATYNSTTFSNFMNSNQNLSTANVVWTAKNPGSLGNSLRVGVCFDKYQYHSIVSLSGTITGGGASAGNSYIGSLNLTPGSNVGYLVFTQTNSSNVAAGNLFANTLILSFGRGDWFRVPTYNSTRPYQLLQLVNFNTLNAITNSTATSVKVQFTSPYNGNPVVANNGYLIPSTYGANTVERYWQYYNVCPPANSTFVTPYQANSAKPTVEDLVSVVVVDINGIITGIPNTILESWNSLSRATDAVNSDGSTNFYRTVINQNSQWIYNINDVVGFPANTANNLSSPTPTAAPYDQTFYWGNDGDGESNVQLGALMNGWDLFRGTESISINLVIAGKSVQGPSGGLTAGITNTTYYNTGLVNYLINNLAIPATANGSGRGDVVVFFSPDKSIVVNNTNGNDIPTDLVNWASLITSSDRAFMDCNYKYQYDQFNNIYRWIPLNGDIAGLCAYTDAVSFPWFSPAGFNRGQIANVTKLAWNPQQGDRDYIYPYGINPVVTFPGQGTYLYGDRTFTQQPSAFDRINVRRLFLYMETSIAIAARYTLFELNDVFTQNAFLNMVNPFLSQIQSCRGISAYQVICDSTINTPFIVDSNQFLAAVLVKPERSINFIQITYYAVPDGVAFNTVSLAS